MLTLTVPINCSADVDCSDAFVIDLIVHVVQPPPAPPHIKQQHIAIAAHSFEFVCAQLDQMNSKPENTVSALLSNCVSRFSRMYSV